MLPPLNPKNPLTDEPLLGAPLYSPLRQTPVQLLKGALIAYDPETEQTGDRVYFQYNPKQLDRTLSPSAATQTDEEGKIFVPIPTEEISLTVELQAVDLMVAQSKIFAFESAGRGLYAQLATLELLLYPKSTAITDYVNDLPKNKGAVKPSARPLLFQWGPRRLLPVYLTNFKVTETLFNIALSPITASVSLTMKTQNVLKTSGLGYELLLQHLQDMEEIAQYESVEVSSE